MPVNGRILPRTFTVAVCTLASRILGLVRDIVTARLFGTGSALDMFVLAFTIPNLFRRLFGEGALSAAFIPVFSGEVADPQRDENRLFAAVITALAALLGVITLAGWAACAAALLFLPLSEDWRLFCVLLAIMLPYLPLICLTAVQGAALNVKGHFFVPALAPVLMNVCWILAAWLFGDRFGVKALSVGVVVSGILQYAAQVPLVLRFRLRLRPLWDLTQPGLRRVVRLMLPVAFGLGLYQVNVLVDRLMAQFCVPEERAISVLYFGNHLMQFPLGVLGMALATAVFPAYSRLSAEGDREGLMHTVNFALRTMLFMALPCMAVMIALRVPIVQVLFERKEFTAAATLRTARVLLYYGVGLWAFCGIHVLARAFYAQQDMRTPVRIAVMMVGLNVALNLILVWPMQEAGLALASAISAAGNMTLLLVALRRRLGFTGARAVVVCVAKCGIASAVSGGLGFLAWRAALTLGGPTGYFGSELLTQVLSLSCGLVTAGLSFLATAWLLRTAELYDAVRSVFDKGRSS